MSQSSASGDLQQSRALAAAIVAPCANRKSVPAPHHCCAVSLPIASQRDLETAWLAKLSDLEPTVRASSLYAGRGFRLSRDTAAFASAPLYIVSAGLGLVDAVRHVPAYSVTVGGRSADAIGERVMGSFDAVGWWRAVSRGRFASPFSILFLGEGPVPVALSQPYARMLSGALGTLPAEDINRLRICGLGLADLLPAQVRQTVMPYDERLQSIFPGTRADFAQRALHHFTTRVLAAYPHADLPEHSDAVRAALSTGQTPVPHRRPRLSDEALINVIAARLSRGPGGIRRTLRALRDEEGIACEQARFTRLYQRAEERSSL